MTKDVKILVVDDEVNIRRLLKETLEDEGYVAYEAENGLKALELMEKENFDLLLLDLRMPKLDGIDLLKKIKKEFEDIPVIIVTGHGTIRDAVLSTRLGVYEFIEKPIDLQNLLLVIKNCLREKKLITEREVLRWERKEPIFFSKPMQAIKKYIEKISNLTQPLLIKSPPGGDRLTIARYIHEVSTRKKDMFRNVDMAFIPFRLQNTFLFGGDGILSRIKRGTVFLDNIDQTEESVQEQLLYLFTDNEYTSKIIGYELGQVKLIIGTIYNLQELAMKNKFNSTLANYLEQMKIEIPPLSVRKEDIPFIFKQYIKYFAHLYNLCEKEVSEEAYKYLKKYSWPGDINELRAFTQKLCLVYADKEKIDLQEFLEVWQEHNKDETSLVPQKVTPLKEAKENFEKDYILKVLNMCNWNIKQAAQLLKIERTYVYAKIKKYNLKKFS